MNWIKTSEQRPRQGERVLLKIRYEKRPVVGYWGLGEFEICGQNLRVECCGETGESVRDFSSSDVTHWCKILNIPEDD